MQALNLAIRLVRTRLGHLIDDDEALFYPDNRGEKLGIDSLDNVFGYAAPSNSQID